MENYGKYLTAPVFGILSEVAERNGFKAYVIGGYVRDCFLGRPCDDIDVVVEGSGVDFAGKVAARLEEIEAEQHKTRHKINVSEFKTYGTAMIKYRGLELEFVGARKESYRKESRNPIVENGSLTDDQLRRDFTINAMAFSLCKADFGALVDPFGGLSDLERGIIRTPQDPDITFSDDPLRMLRAVRFATKLSTPQLQFRITPECMEAMRRNRNRLQILTRERIAEELNKMLVVPKPSKAFRLMYEAGLLDLILPSLTALKGVNVMEGKGHKDNFDHTLQVLDNVAELEMESRPEPNVWLRWAALLHDVGKARTRRYDPSVGWTFHGHEVVGGRMVPKIFASLKLPLNEKMEYVKKLVELHLRPIALVTEEVTDSAVRRLLFEAGDDIDDLMILCHGDITSKNLRKVERLHANFELVQRKLVEVEEKDAIRNFKNPIDGDYIMKLFGIEPCRTIGELKEYVKEAILNGDIPNEFEAADALMRGRAAELGLVPRE
ncbi:MAG: CCA tRNA nucleotidyltransferase [Rikenellaceae bacterium]|nr:CCA tRNA nucleotidyltransferase [Rikenellaceae bacterium]